MNLGSGYIPAPAIVIYTVQVHVLPRTIWTRHKKVELTLGIPCTLGKFRQQTMPIIREPGGAGIKFFEFFILFNFNMLHDFRKLKESVNELQQALVKEFSPTTCSCNKSNTLT